MTSSALDHLSKELQADPSQAEARVAGYEEQLTGLFENYKKALLRELTQDADAVKLQKATSARTYTIDIGAFSKKMERLTREELIEPASEIIWDETKNAYLHGKKHGDIQLRPFGILLGAPLNIRQVEWRKLKIIIEKDKGEFKGITDATNQRIRSIIADGVLNETKYGEITRGIVKAVDGVGITRASTMVRTETMKAVNLGVKDQYGAAGIEEFERVEAIDERTCTDFEIDIGSRHFTGCGELDGQIFSREEADQVDAKMHPNCRGTWIAHISVPEVTAE